MLLHWKMSQNLKDSTRINYKPFFETHKSSQRCILGLGRLNPNALKCTFRSIAPQTPISKNGNARMSVKILITGAHGLIVVLNFLVKYTKFNGNILFSCSCLSYRLCAHAIASARRKGFGPFFGTPCGILAPLYSILETEFGLHTIPREDNAIGIAAGTAMAGRRPVVLMQNSGLGQSVNAIASFIVPYQISILLIVSLRGIAPDQTSENAVMGHLTEPLLDSCGIQSVRLEASQLTAQVNWVQHIIYEQCQSVALLVPPSIFGWQA